MHFFPKKIQVETETETDKDRENSTTNIYNLESIKVSIENTKDNGIPIIYRFLPFKKETLKI